MRYILDNMVRSNLISERDGSEGNAYPYEINFSIADTISTQVVTDTAGVSLGALANTRPSV